ncbi:MAG TPA: 2'-5' RNA ligase family protein [Aliicoccus persicus]|uniref:2'-5' RNA ligase family protein n=1 Tax=Aliicoccus persicus TaxID=930138 RepID=A0A921DYN3_9STAP|nr:2'-5' RNA ligase family protein [Aliicoccus persicus]
MNLGIVLFPSKELQDKVNEYRMRYDAHFALIPPHITIKDEFEIDPADKDKVIDYVKNVAKNHSPVEVAIKKVSSFEPTSHVIYFKVNKNDEIVALYEALNDGDFYGVNKHPFVPHFTIGQKFSSVQEHDDVYSTLNMVGIEHTEVIDEITLCQREDDGEWKVLESFKLEK